MFVERDLRRERSPKNVPANVRLQLSLAIPRRCQCTTTSPSFPSHLPSLIRRTSYGWSPSRLARARSSDGCKRRTIWSRFSCARSSAADYTPLLPTRNVNQRRTATTTSEASWTYFLSRPLAKRYTTFSVPSTTCTSSAAPTQPHSIYTAASSPHTTAPADPASVSPESLASHNAVGSLTCLSYHHRSA